MNVDDYQIEAMRTCGMAGVASLKLQHHDAQLIMAALGLAGESGEFVDLVKKHFFHGHDLEINKLSKELGDIMWYVAVAADALGLELSYVMNENIAKLRQRYPQGFTPAASIHRDREDERGS